MSKFISQGKYKIVKNIIYGVKILSKVQFFIYGHTTGQKFKACIYPRIQALFILKFIMSKKKW